MDQEGRGEAERRDWKTDAGAAAQHARYHPSLIRAPPLPCPSVAPSLTFGPSHNLCPLSPSAERLISRSPQQPLWFSCDLPSNHGIVVEFFSPSGVVARIWNMAVKLCVHFSSLLRGLPQK